MWRPSNPPCRASDGRPPALARQGAIWTRSRAAARLAAAVGVVALLGIAPAVWAAEVVQVVRARQGKGGIAYLRLAQGEIVREGDTFTFAGGALRVEQVGGPRARAVWTTGGPRAGDKATLVVPAAGAGRAAPPAPIAQAWKTAAPGGLVSGSAARDAAIFWARTRMAPRPLVVARRTRAGQQDEAPARVEGDLLLTAAAVATGSPVPSWAAARLSSRLEVPGIGGMPLVYRHALSLYGDSIGTDLGGARARRLLEVRRMSLAWEPGAASPFWARVGRVLASSATTLQQVDGAVVGAAAGGFELEAHGGLSPDLVSLAPRTDAARYGGTLRWRPTLGALQGEVSAGWSGARTAGGAEAHLLGARIQAEHAAWGEVLAELDLAAGAPELQGTAMEGEVLRSSLRPVRGWLGLTTRAFGSWRYRMRYSHHKAELTRELALVMPWDSWVTATDHTLLLSADGELGGGWWLSPWLDGGYADSAERFDGFRFGGGLRAGWRGVDWSWRALAWTAVAEHATSVTAGTGTRHLLSERLSLSLNARYRRDDMSLQSAVAHRVRLDGGLDWITGPWTLEVLLGGEQVVAGPGASAAGDLDLLDCLLVVRRRL